MDHALPGVPVVACAIAPDIEAAGNLLGVEDVGHLLIHVAADVVHSGGEDAVVAAIEVEVVSIAHVRHVVGGQVEIAILVVVAGEEAGGVERAAHRKNGGEGFGMAKSHVNCMVTPKAAPYRTETGTAIAMANEGDDLFENVLLKAQMAGEPGTRDDGAVVPAFGVN